jgi:hypothetical protein
MRIARLEIVMKYAVFKVKGAVLVEHFHFGTVRQAWHCKRRPGFPASSPPAPPNAALMVLQKL